MIPISRFTQRGPLSEIEFSIAPAENNMVTLSFTLPRDIVRDFSSLVQAFAGLFRFAEVKTAHASPRSIDPEEVARREELSALYRQKCVERYNLARADGLEHLAAIRHVAGRFRAESHPWCHFDQVRAEVNAALGRKRGRRSQSLPPSPPQAVGTAPSPPASPRI